MQVAQAEHIQGSQPRAQSSPFWALARQLQLRLRYARLKVDHGWQKQSLNEVENLYFHHRHFRESPTNTSTRRSLPSDAEHVQDHASSSKIPGQDISSSVSVFSSRQQPNDILVLHPRDTQEQRQSNDDDASMQVNDSTAHVACRNVLVAASHAPAVQLHGTSVSTEGLGGIDFISEMPRASKVGDVGKAGLEGSLPSSDPTGSNAAIAAAPNTASVGQTVKQAVNDSYHTDDDRLGQSSSPASNVATPDSNVGIPILTSSHPAGKQAPTAQSTHATSGSHRSSTLTYDSFWSSHAVGVTYGYGPYATNSKPVHGSSALPPLVAVALPPSPSMSSRELS